MPFATSPATIFEELFTGLICAGRASETDDRATYELALGSKTENQLVREWSHFSLRVGAEAEIGWLPRNVALNGRRGRVVCWRPD